MSNDLTAPAAYHTQAAVDFYLEQTGKGNRDNSVTVRSARAARMYDPGVWAPRVSPTPLLLIVADDDRLTLPASRRRPTNEPSTPERLTLID
ncbi:alpha/beta hydrolase, partial [Streptomyces sp. NPDC005373]